jgi:hypothetical protein
MRRLVLGLNAATVLLVIAGILVLVVPSPAPRAQAANNLLASSSPGEDTVRQPAPDLGAADRVVRTDIFSARRSAPTRRYTFGEPGEESNTAAPDAGGAMAVAGEPVDSSAASTGSDAVPHLYGTMLGAESTALLRLDAGVSEPRIYRVGDRAGGYRVAEIAERSVALIGPGGRVVLKLRAPQ